MKEGDKVSFCPVKGEVEHDCEVVKVWSDTCVNLVRPDGRLATSVPLRSDGMAGYYFMPKLGEVRELTFGEKAVGLTFNPSNNPAVDECKRGFAAVIDQMNDLRTAATAVKNYEVARMAALAITEAQTAQMWAVKAITWSH